MCVKIRKITAVPNTAACKITPMKRYIAELIGTMVLVLIGCGSAVIASYYVGNLRDSFCFRSRSIGHGLRDWQRIGLPH